MGISASNMGHHQYSYGKSPFIVDFPNNNLVKCGQNFEKAA
jgi:hypothetical protein